MKVLIVGAAGRVGRAATVGLGEEYELVLGDVQPLDDPRYTPLDVLNPEQVQQAVSQVDTVLYMAIVDSSVFDHGRAPGYAHASFGVQVEGVYNVLRAAAETGGKHVLYTSSVSALNGYPEGQMIGSQDRHLGGGVYGITKGFGEELCRMFHQERGLPVTILRLGNVYIPELQGHWQQAHPHPSRVHVQDVVRALGLVLACPRPKFALVHLVGDNRGRHWDLEAARALYGWQPTVSFGPDGRPLEPTCP